MATLSYVGTTSWIPTIPPTVAQVLSVVVLVLLVMALIMTVLGLIISFIEIVLYAGATVLIFVGLFYLFDFISVDKAIELLPLFTG